MNVTLTVVRHPRVCAPAGVCYGRTDLAADARHEQALLDELSAALSPRRIVSSPALRCRGLATRLAERWRRPCDIEPRLQEMDFGHWEGRPWDAVPRIELDAWALQPVVYAPGGGESLCAMAERVHRWVLDIATSPGAVLAITHGGVMRLLITCDAGLPLSSVVDVPAPEMGHGVDLRFDRIATAAARALGSQSVTGP